MATSNWSRPPGTCHTDLPVDNKKVKRTYLNTGPSWNPEGGERGQMGRQKWQGFLKQTMKANLHGKNSNAHVLSDHP